MTQVINRLKRKTFQIVNNFFAVYFVNSISMYIFAPAFIDKTYTSTIKRIFYSLT